MIAKAETFIDAGWEGEDLGHGKAPFPGLGLRMACIGPWVHLILRGAGLLHGA